MCESMYSAFIRASATIFAQLGQGRSVMYKVASCVMWLLHSVAISACIVVLAFPSLLSCPIVCFKGAGQKFGWVVVKL